MLRATISALALLLLVAGCSSSPPLSGARATTATAVKPAAAPKPQAVAPAVDRPPTPAVELAAVPAPAIIEPVAPAPASAAARNDVIALVLPLESPVYGRAADAVKAGFLAAAARAGSGARIRVIAHGDDGVLPAIAAAENARVRLVVGPLTRDDLKTVLAMSPEHPRMLALNQVDDGTALPPDTYSMALSVDSDAILLARTARADGAKSIALVAANAPLPQRFVAAFEAEWRRGGGNPSRIYPFDPSPDQLATLRRDIASRPTDAIVLAVDGEHAALTKSFLPPLRVYAISQISDELPSPISHDLDGVRYVEVPWLADPDDPTLAGLPHANLGNPVLERLYALGLDAFVVAQMLAVPIPPSIAEVEGATGHLSLTPTRVFARQGRLMEIRDGRAKPLTAGQ